MNKIRTIKGLKIISLAIIFAFIGPFVIHQAFQNKNHEFYLFVLVLGLLLAGFSIILGFLGISNLVNGLLGDSKNKIDY
tara:strand:+ start:444 stop:680 length:237 start_codon:yes stop_codon:yes gene_type:complete